MGRVEESTQIFLFDEDLTASQMSAIQIATMRPERVANLIHQPARGNLVHWRLTVLDRHQRVHRPEEVIGAIVRTKNGNTSPLVAIDPSLRKVLTKSGSVYSLGMPDPAFAAASPDVVSYLGF